MARICLLSTHGLRSLTLIALIGFGISSWAGETVLHSFNDAPSGASPTANLISDAAGNLYGTSSQGGTYGAGTVFKLSHDSKGRWTETVLLNFGNAADGGFPGSGLTMDSAGNLYGTTDIVVFELSPGANGKWTETILHTFQGTIDGSGPNGPLVFDSAGNLYGTTYYGGGANGFGTVFELSPNGQGSWTETILYSFTDGFDGAYPSAGLILDQAGNLYGTTTEGGDSNCNNYYSKIIGCGVVFELSRNAGTWTETTLHAFNLADGMFPYGNLIADAAGNLYGTTWGGPGCCGTVYRLSPNSGNWTLTTIYQFAGGTDGANPVAGLIFDAKGNLFGTTEYGGESSACSNANCGIVFELSPTGNSFWREKILHRFSFPGGFGLQPEASLMLDGAGNLYGTTTQGGASCSIAYSQGCGSVFKLTPTANGPWTAAELTVFPGLGDGLSSRAGLVADSLGNLYGTTQNGGGANFGTVFEMSPKRGGGWSEKVLYAFSGGPDGGDPSGELILDAQGNLYGTAVVGGDPNCSCGVVFKLSPLGTGGWQETLLYTFLGRPDGAYPYAALTSDTAGNMYGTTSGGGGGYCNGGGCGTVFKLSPTSSGQWTETLLHRFVAFPDGLGPSGPLAIDAEGSLYGTTSFGGQSNFGIVYKLTPTTSDSWTEHILYTFQGSSDGASPNGVMFGPDRDLYGTTASGGATTSCVPPYGCGTVFQLSRTASGWIESVIYTFDPAKVGGEGRNPLAAPAFDAAGNLYGTTIWGGLAHCIGLSCGTVFELTPTSSGEWTETILTRFNYYDGSNPQARLLVDSSGNVFGTTYYGGTENFGVVFAIKPGGSANAIEPDAGPSPPPFHRRNSRRNFPTFRDYARGVARGTAEQ
jgi:uncharacterized repeat protein (TIGR03803 family)